jgi:hypothetical protein
MNKEMKSLLNSLIVIALYYFALLGIVKLFWNTSDEYMFTGRVKFLGLLIILITLVGVIVPYHLFTMHTVEIIYYMIIRGHLLILIVGGASYIFIKK